MSLEIKTKPDVTGMYETTFISVPELSEQDYRKLTSKFEKLINDHAGQIINVEHWGQKKLAYDIGKHTNAYYTFIEFKAPRTFISKLKLEFGYDESIIRHLTVSLEKYGVEYNIKRRNHEFGERPTHAEKLAKAAKAEAGEGKPAPRKKKTLATTGDKA